MNSKVTDRLATGVFGLIAAVIAAILVKEDDLYQLQLDRITEDKLNELTDQDLKVLAIKRQMDSGYALTPQYIKNKGVTAKEMAVVSEHLDELPGVDVTSDWKRDYPYNGLLRTMIGSISDSNEGLPKSDFDPAASRAGNQCCRIGSEPERFQELPGDFYFFDRVQI